jgi:uncharacterized protein (DUF1800 family)
VPDLASRADVCRLFGRATFGATAADITAWEGQPYEAMVDSLFPPGPPGTVGRLPEGDEAEQQYQNYQTSDVASAQRWWVERMRIARYPLEERMTLFWHDHFATAALGEPNVGLTMVQNQTLRANVFGSFRTLANAMTVDAAMLTWLSGINNVVGGVNENYAREFFELFTLGVQPQVYTENDVRQAAKAFTGFTVNTVLQAGQFNTARHDPSVKHVLGRTIGGHLPGSPEEALEYQEVLEAALAHNNGITASRFVAYKMILELGYSPAADDGLIDDVAWEIRAGDRWDLRAGLRALLLHPRWRYADPSAGQLLVRSPIELAVHAVKVLGFPSPNVYGSLYWPQIAMPILERAGQVPLVPPNVGGWPNDVGWLSQTTVLARYDLLNALVLYFYSYALQLVHPLPASGDLDGWAAYMGLPGFSTNTRLYLQDYLDDPGTTDETQKQQSMFVLVGTSPDWQVM